MLESLESIADAIPVKREGKEVVITSPNIGLAVKCQPSNSTNPVLFITSKRGHMLSSRPNYSPSSNVKSGTDKQETSFSIPSEAIPKLSEEAENCSLSKVSFLAFRNDKFFARQNGKKAASVVGSEVINARISKEEFINLTDNPVAMNFSVLPKASFQAALAKYLSAFPLSFAHTREINSDNIKIHELMEVDLRSAFEILEYKPATLKLEKNFPKCENIGTMLKVCLALNFGKKCNWLQNEAHACILFFFLAVKLTRQDRPHVGWYFPISPTPLCFLFHRQQRNSDQATMLLAHFGNRKQVWFGKHAESLVLPVNTHQLVCRH